MGCRHIVDTKAFLPALPNTQHVTDTSIANSEAVVQVFEEVCEENGSYAKITTPPRTETKMVYARSVRAANGKNAWSKGD